MKSRTLRIPRILALCVCLMLAAVMLAACGSQSADKSAITSVELDGKGNIEVRASLTKAFLSGYSESKVYLFELPSVYSTDADLSELDPVGEVKAKANLRLDVPVYDGVRTRLYSSFLVASYDPDTRRYTALTTPMALSNPELAAGDDTASYDAEISIKGLAADYPADAIRLGVSHAVVEVPMERLLLADWQEDAVAYVWNGTTAYLHPDTLAELDSTVARYQASGIRVYLRFTLGAPEEGYDVPTVLYPETAGSAESYAVNMASESTAAIMEGFFDFMAARYVAAVDGTCPVPAFIVGYRVNHAPLYNDGGDTALASFVTNYEKLVRIAHTAIRSHHPEGQVYISLDYHRSAQHMQGGWDVPTFLAAFRDECVLRGDYDWAIACELYADSPAVWNESSRTDSAYYTVHSLGTLTDILTGDKYRTPEGQARGLMVSGVAIPAVAAGGTPSDEAANMQAASYAFTYMTCVQNGHVDALIYSCHTDLAAMADHRPLCGLWTVENGPDGLTVKAPRAIYDVFKQVDTNGASILSAGLSAVIGSSYTKLESALAGNAQPISLIDGKGTVGEYDKTHKKASPLFRFDGGDLQGFSDGGNLTYAELVRAETLGTVTLRARFDTEAVSDPAGMTVELPSSRIIGGKELIFDLYAGPVRTGSEGGTDKPTVTLRLTRPSKGAGSAGDGTILYEATVTDVKGGVWQTLTFDIASFTEQLDASDEVTMTLLVDYPSAETWHAATELGLAGVYITGNTAADRPSTGVVVGIVAALVVLVVVGFLFLRSRRRRY